MDYLKNLQESTLLGTSFLKFYNDQAPISEDDFEVTLTEEEQKAVNEIELVTMAKGAITVGVVVASIIGGAIAAVKLSKQNPECIKYNVAYRMKCNRIVNLRKRVFVLRSKMALCNNSKDVQACKDAIQKEIQAMATKIADVGEISAVSAMRGSGIPSKKADLKPGQKPEDLKNPKEREIKITIGKHKKK